jgi:hypothetical protein
MNLLQSFRIVAVTAALIAAAILLTVKGIFPFPYAALVLMFIPDEFGPALRRCCPRWLLRFRVCAWKGSWRIR